MALLLGCASIRQPKVVKIGLVAPFEGTFRYIGYDAIYAARLAIREINAAGGVRGWMLELVAYDDRAEIEMATASARSLAVDPDVVAVIGHYRQASTVAAAEIYQSEGIPLLVINAWLPVDQGGVWHLSPTPESVADALWSLHADQTPETAASVSSGTAEGPATILSARGVLRVSPLKTAVTPWPETAFAMLDPVPAAETLAAWRSLGWVGAWVGGADLMASAFVQVAGPAGEGARVITPYPLPSDVPDSEAWQADYLAVGPHVSSPGPFALPTYEAVYTLAEAIRLADESAGDVSRLGIAEALASVQRTGYLGIIAWDAQGFGQGWPLYLYQWEQGTLSLVRRMDAEPVR